MSDALDLGPCCMCGGTDGVTAIIMLSVKNKMRSHGWGCVVCNLPMEGASAVLCAGCFPGYQDGSKQLRVACAGYPRTDGRVPISELTEPHVHDMRIPHE